MVHANLRCAVAMISATGMIGPASAQVSPLDIFGGILGVAQVQAAREAWGRLPSVDRNCLQRALATRNTNIENLVHNGIGPDDGRIGPFVTQCRRFTEAKLGSDGGSTPDSAISAK